MTLFDDLTPIPCAAIAQGGGAYYSTLNDCAVTANSVGATNRNQGDPRSYAFGGGAYCCTLNNCTLTSNSASASIEGIYLADISESGGGAAYSTPNNCIVCFNVGYEGWPGHFTYSGEDEVDDASTLNYCWVSNPVFQDYAAGNLRLQSNSPCINAGNNAYVTNATDLDGNPRIVGGTVDIGAYEFQSLSLINFSVLSNQAGFNITGQSNQVVIVETSTDLSNWSPLATNTLNGHPFPFRDPTPATLPRRFYRAQAQ